jgi:hypothetical protein
MHPCLMNRIEIKTRNRIVRNRKHCVRLIVTNPMLKTHSFTGRFYTPTCMPMTRKTQLNCEGTNTQHPQHRSVQPSNWSDVTTTKQLSSTTCVNSPIHKTKPTRHIACQIPCTRTFVPTAPRCFVFVSLLGVELAH